MRLCEEDNIGKPCQTKTQLKEIGPRIDYFGRNLVLFCAKLVTAGCSSGPRSPKI